LNGKVERSQKTDKSEFYATVDINSEDIQDKLAEWQHYYNWMRPHSALKGTPMERYFELCEETLSLMRSRSNTTHPMNGFNTPITRWI
jgi:hypothetical protein